MTTLDPGESAPAPQPTPSPRPTSTPARSTNTASATGTPSGGTLSDPTDDRHCVRQPDTRPSTPRQDDRPRATRTSTVGRRIDYSFIVTNTGNVTLSRRSASATTTSMTLPVCDVPRLAPGESATCTASHTVTQADLDAGSVTNNADRHGHPERRHARRPTDTRPATRTIDRSRPGPHPRQDDRPRATRTATVGARSTTASSSPTPATSRSAAITVSDDRNVDAAPVCDVTTLEPGESATCTASHTVTQADLDAGAVDQHRRRHRHPDRRHARSIRRDTATVTATQNPALDPRQEPITAGDPYSTVGDDDQLQLHRHQHRQRHAQRGQRHATTTVDAAPGLRRDQPRAR